MLAHENPFRADRIEALAFRAPGSSIAELVDRFDAMGRRAEIVGAHGAGKTTLLEEVGRMLNERGTRCACIRIDGQRRLPPWAEMVTRDPAQEVVLVDGADAMNALQWRRFERWSRRARGLLVTTHRRGRLPLLLHCETSLRLLEELVDELAPGLRLKQKRLCADLFEEHQGDLRQVFRRLYDADLRLALSQMHSACHALSRP